MMQFITRILTLLILVLTVIPCTDAAAHNCKSPEKHQATVTSHTTHSDHVDTCSPFCTCSCCGITLNITPTLLNFKIENPIFLETKEYPLKKSIFISNHFGNIWQPPKITV